MTKIYKKRPGLAIFFKKKPMNPHQTHWSNRWLSPPLCRSKLQLIQQLHFANYLLTKISTYLIPDKNYSYGVADIDALKQQIFVPTFEFMKISFDLNGF